MEWKTNFATRENVGQKEGKLQMAVFSLVFRTLSSHFQTGHTFIRKHFGAAALPNVTNQIDCFGHSAVFPQLLREFGYKLHVTNRVGDHLDFQLSLKSEQYFFW